MNQEGTSAGRWRPPQWLWLTLIVAVGFGLRVDTLRQESAFALNYGSQSDAVDAYAAAVNLAHGEPSAKYLAQPRFNAKSQLPGPLWTVFCLSGLWLWGSITGAALLVLLCATGAIILTYFLALRTVGSSPALMAALLQATSTSGIHFSVPVFNPSVMPFLGGLLVLALWRTTQRDHSRAILWVAFFLLVMPQFHLSGLILIPMVVYMLWLCHRRLNVYWLFLGVFLGFLCYVPYLYGEIEHHWQNTRGIAAGGPVRYSIDTLKVFISPFSYIVDFWTPPWAYTTAEFQALCRAAFVSRGIFIAASMLAIVVALFLAAGGILLGREAMRGFFRTPRETFARSPGITFLVVALLGPLAVAFLAGLPFYPRYALVLLAPLFCLFGASATRWLTHARFRPVIIALICTALATNLVFIPRVHQFQRELAETTDRFVPSFHNLERVYQSLRLHAGDTRVVGLQDREYLRSLASNEYKWLHGVDLIRRYIAIRNRENAGALERESPPALYIVRRSAEVDASDPGLAFRGNGIAIVAAPRN